eukprot:Amastigsp_a339575_17.p3 type:complete len:211 gc:universal Amastigsp_a339575_17:995-363(-)
MPAISSRHCPVCTSRFVPKRSSGDRESKTRCAVSRAVVRNTGSPVSSESSPNSSRKLPHSATDDHTLASAVEPFKRCTRPAGSPVGVMNAFRSRRAKSSARRRSSVVYAPERQRPRSSPRVVQMRCAERRPPTTRMFVSKVETKTSRLKLTLRTTNATIEWKSSRRPSMYSESSMSIGVVASPPKVSRPEHESGRSSSAGNACNMYIEYA